MPTSSPLYTLGHLNPPPKLPLHCRSRHARRNPRKIGMKTNTPVKESRRNSVREERRRLNWQAGGLLEWTSHSTKRRGNTSLNDDECLLSVSSVSSLVFHICPLICFWSLLTKAWLNLTWERDFENEWVILGPSYSFLIVFTTTLCVVIKDIYTPFDSTQVRYKLNSIKPNLIFLTPSKWRA